MAHSVVHSVTVVSSPNGYQISNQTKPTTSSSVDGYCLHSTFTIIINIVQKPTIILTSNREQKAELA